MHDTGPEINNEMSASTRNSPLQSCFYSDRELIIHSLSQDLVETILQEVVYINCLFPSTPYLVCIIKTNQVGEYNTLTPVVGCSRKINMVYNNHPCPQDPPTGQVIIGHKLQTNHLITLARKSDNEAGLSNTARRRCVLTTLSQAYLQEFQS